MNPPRDFLPGADVHRESIAATSRYVCEHHERVHPGFMAECGITEADLDAPALSIEESVAAGWMRPEEARAIQGVATREDLIALGHTDVEVESMLAHQRDRACASSV